MNECYTVIQYVEFRISQSRGQLIGKILTLNLKKHLNRNMYKVHNPVGMMCIFCWHDVCIVLYFHYRGEYTENCENVVQYPRVPQHTRTEGTERHDIIHDIYTTLTYHTLISQYITYVLCAQCSVLSAQHRAA